jgi:hypothetical protein
MLSAPVENWKILKIGQPEIGSTHVQAAVPEEPFNFTTRDLFDGIVKFL